MASIASPRERPSRNTSQDESASSQSPSSDSQNTFPETQPRSINMPHSINFTSSPTSPLQSSAVPPIQSQPSSPPPEVRTCWICQQDDTDDPSPTTLWRTPCPCSLTAHDACLLEWIANEEAPKPGEIAHSHQIRCPQCQHLIKIQRPRDLLVSVVDKIQWAAKRMMLPAAVGATIGCVYSGLLVYGLNAMTLVFGADETRAILVDGFVYPRDDANIIGIKRAFRTLLQITDPWFPYPEHGTNPTLFLAVPLIGPALVLLRTRLADQAFPLLLPIVSTASPFPFCHKSKPDCI